MTQCFYPLLARRPWAGVIKDSFFLGGGSESEVGVGVVIE